MNSKDLKNKSVLLIAPAFFGYEYKIKEELECRGTSVTLLRENIDSTNLRQKIINKMPQKYISKKREAYFCKQIDYLKGSHFDYIFGIRLDNFDKVIMDHMKSLFPESYYLLYFWDSCANMRKAEEVSKYFDQVFTFDSLDYEAHKNDGWKFRPLFYIPEYEVVSDNEPNIDIMFVSSLSVERARYYLKLKKICDVNNLNLYAYFFAPKYVFYFNRFFHKEYRMFPSSLVHGIGLPRSEILDKLKETKVVFDCCHSTQTGLSIRTLECIGARKKMVTTNRSVNMYDFYNSNNIVIVDENNLDIIPVFASNPEYKDLPEDIYNKYSLKAWVDELFSIKGA